MNKPPGLHLFLFSSNEQRKLGSVETPAILRVLRPGTFALWFIVFVAEAMAIVSTGGGSGENYLVMVLTTALFACVHIQFWYEESEQGRRFHHAIERMRGHIYEDEATSLPNSRHFVFELRRQMMRSVRNGRGFSLILAEVESSSGSEEEFAHLGKALRGALSDGDFVAHLNNHIFAAIALDEGQRTAADKADAVQARIGQTLGDGRTSRFPVVSLTGYQGELEVKDFLHRAQLDLETAQARGGHKAAVAAKVAARAS